MLFCLRFLFVWYQGQKHVAIWYQRGQNTFCPNIICMWVSQKSGVSKTRTAYTKKTRHSLIGTLPVRNDRIANAFVGKFPAMNRILFENLCLLLRDTRWCPRCNAVSFTAECCKNEWWLCFFDLWHNAAFFQNCDQDESKDASCDSGNRNGTT